MKAEWKTGEEDIKRTWNGKEEGGRTEKEVIYIYKKSENEREAARRPLKRSVYDQGVQGQGCLSRSGGNLIDVAGRSLRRGVSRLRRKEGQTYNGMQEGERQWR